MDHSFTAILEHFLTGGVSLALATVQQLSVAIDVLGDVAELRRAKIEAGFFAALPAYEQPPWADDLLHRIEAEAGPAVCVLDTGVNRGHPLIEPWLTTEDASAVEPNWGTHDHHGHGTEMAGLALFGDLAAPLAAAERVRLRHALESVKILPPAAANDPDLYGAVTAQAVSRPEVQAPDRRRVFLLAVTAPDDGDRGQPTSWSAALDALAAGRGVDAGPRGLVYLDAGDTAARRLFVVSAGNVHPDTMTVEHLDVSDTTPVHDPAQAWNVLTVGAYTEKAAIDDAAWPPGWQPIARPGDLSPWSSTGALFGSPWPNKPDVVLEGGNVAHDGAGDTDVGIPDLCLLTTYARIIEQLFGLTSATSAAAAQGARLAAQVLTKYPDLWPETVRALIVHSARWTNRMHDAIEGATGKQAIGGLVRRYGFGVPDETRAIRSANDALTIVAQAVIHPYRSGSMREMHVHRLPWPADTLAQLEGAQVRLRVTLSYFIEPNPARLGWRTRHRYQSHGLRFDVKTPEESFDEFRKRLNKAALDEGEKKPSTISDSPKWLLGDRNRHRGSLHADVWEGTAADLAARGVIGIYPVSGWWKEQPKHDRSGAGVRYALVVSIETDAEGVDVWTPVAQQVGIPIEAIRLDI